jgi:hypothetical protein
MTNPMKKPMTFWITESKTLTRLTPPRSTSSSPAKMDSAPTVPVA